MIFDQNNRAIRLGTFTLAGCGLGFLMATTAAFADTDAESCRVGIEQTSEKIEELEGNDTKQKVEVTTNEADVTVNADDAEPTENWFGSPPDIEAAKTFLNSAKAASNDENFDGCLAQLADANAALGDTDNADGSNAGADGEIITQPAISEGATSAPVSGDGSVTNRVSE